MFCTQCGASSAPTDAFCAKCGKALTDAVPTNSNSQSASASSSHARPRTSRWLIGLFISILILLIVVMTLSDTDAKMTILASLGGTAIRTIAYLVLLSAFIAWWQFFKKGGRRAAILSLMLVPIVLGISYVLFGQ